MAWNRAPNASPRVSKRRRDPALSMTALPRPKLAIGQRHKQFLPDLHQIRPMPHAKRGQRTEEPIESEHRRVEEATDLIGDRALTRGGTPEKTVRT